MKIKNNIIGSIIGVISVLAAIIAIPQKILSENITIISNKFSNNYGIVMPIIAFILGLFISYIYIKYTFKVQVDTKGDKNVLTFRNFENSFQKIVKNGDIDEIKVFGYTSETFYDYFKYALRYNENLGLKILNRSWLAEKIDEELHNEKISSLNLRLWKKSVSIEHHAKKPWDFLTKRDVKYYDLPPIIKGVILKGKRTTVVYFSFYEWVEIPSIGGSQFKGTDTNMIFLEKLNENHIEIIDNLESQFDMIWKLRSQEIVNGKLF